jgi:hypothetical protein
MPAGTVHQLSRTDARRVAVRAQLLTARRPQDLVELVEHLTLLQIDPTAAVAPNADLVARSRLGYDYDPAELVTALEERRLVELPGLVRPAGDVALFRAETAAWPGSGELLPGRNGSATGWPPTTGAARRSWCASTATGR